MDIAMTFVAHLNYHAGPCQKSRAASPACGGVVTRMMPPVEVLLQKSVYVPQPAN